MELEVVSVGRAKGWHEIRNGVVMRGIKKTGKCITVMEKIENGKYK